MADEKKPEETAAAPAKPTDPAAAAAPAKKKFNLQVKDLQLKQAPMEAVINRET